MSMLVAGGSANENLNPGATRAILADRLQMYGFLVEDELRELLFLCLFSAPAPRG
jgi:hypothetical protein